MRRSFWILAALTVLTLSSCSWFDGGDTKQPLPGLRLPALPLSASLKPSSNVSPFVLPDAWVNQDWPQTGGFPGHTLQHLALSSGPLTQAWSVDVGDGSSRDHPLTAPPVVVNGRVLAMDRSGVVTAVGIKDGRRLWRVDTSSRDEDDHGRGGGLAVDQDVVYVTSGYAELLALTVESGAEMWRVRLSAPSRSAPTVLDGRVYVLTLDGQILALSAKDGQTLWSYRASVSGTGVLGTTAPAANADMVVAPFSSGDLVALQAGSGLPQWSDSLAPTLRLGGLTTVADMRALPVIHDNIVLALSFGGRLLALDTRTGNRLWSLDIGGQDTPWVAGQHIFVLTKDAQLANLDLRTGAVRWVLELPRFDDVTTREYPVQWMGPVLAGGRLMVVRTGGQVYDIDPATGTVIRDWSLGDLPAVPMVLAGQTLLTLSHDATLTAWR